MKRLLFIVNEDWFFVSHRLPIAKAAQKQGYEVHVAANGSEARGVIQAEGITFHPLDLSRSGRSPLKEFQSLVALFLLMRRMRPNLVHLVTIKPVIYGGIAARLLRIPAVAAIPGLGHSFTGAGIVKRSFQWFLLFMFRCALGGKNCHVIVQNISDEHAIQSILRTSPDHLTLIPGSGVNLKHYSVEMEPSGSPVVVMAARLLRDKGVLDYISASRMVLKRYPQVTFLLAGDIDPGNPSSLTSDDLEAIRVEGIVKLCGFQRDIQALFAQCNLVVLPSYREGLPKVLIEASACGRAIVTTDAPGCRDAVISGETALLVPPRDPYALAEAIIQLIEAPKLRHSMGRRGRELAESQFDINKVINIHILIYAKLILIKT